MNRYIAARFSTVKGAIKVKDVLTQPCVVTAGVSDEASTC